jgi:hypothetical protein
MIVRLAVFAIMVLLDLFSIFCYSNRKNCDTPFQFIRTRLESVLKRFNFDVPILISQEEEKRLGDFFAKC